jgi:RHS repeat-associated protein
MVEVPLAQTDIVHHWVVANATAPRDGNAFTLTRQLGGRNRLAALAVDGHLHAAYTYDSENRLSVVSNGVFSAGYAYVNDGWDNGYTVTLTNGTILSRDVTRDPYRRRLVAAITNAVGQSVVSGYCYLYDLLGRAIARNADTFDYNDRSEVTATFIEPSNTNCYEYDGIGNNRWTTVNGATNTYTVNALNQYTNIANGITIVPSYDMDGNMLNNGVWSYAWDAENRLSAVYSNAVLVVSNAYDLLSRRVLKITPTATHTFVYDGWNLAQETIATASGVTTNRYVWGKDLSGTMQGAGGVGGLLAVSLNGTWHFPFYDNNGNITYYASESGIVVAFFTYNAFGKTIAQSGPMAGDFRFRFSTKYFDTETGLYYYGYRFYSPERMRWMNRDPIEEMDGVNLFSFVINNPLLTVDSFGLRRIFFSSMGKEIGQDRRWLFWGTSKYIQSQNGNVEWCGHRFWKVWKHDEHYLPGKFLGVIEKWDEQMKSFYNSHRNTRWTYRYIPYGYLFAFSTAFDNSPHGEPWDYKDKLNVNTWYIFNDEAYRFDSIGNITWGAIMKSYGFPRLLALTGGGARQLFDDFRNWRNGGMTTRQFINADRNVFGDEARDGKAISEGYRWNP